MPVVTQHTFLRINWNGFFSKKTSSKHTTLKYTDNAPKQNV